LADFQTRANEFRTANIRLLAASVDTEEDARKSVNELALSYPIGYGLSAQEISALTGAFFEAQKKYLHATGFILRPDGAVAHAVYSTGPIGRYTAADALDVATGLAKRK
jgi:alkyl hydroperoxide reductase subunit AhpC